MNKNTFPVILKNINTYCILAAINDNQIAKKKFHSLSPSAQKEIVRYISFLKTEESIDKNVHKAIQFLMGNVPIIGQEKATK